MKIEQMDKRAAQTLAREAEAALADLCEKYGLTVQISGGKYDPVAGTYVPKLTFQVEGGRENGFARDAELVGLKADDYGKTFRSAGRIFKISGINLRATKMPILATDTRDGKTYKFQTRAVLSALGRDVPSYF